ncbi:MAG TPA: aldo/keto reductase [Myxococcaceae bacterium]|nr:aldo/keto reductase [Myxococcaceae bacterium]
MRTIGTSDLRIFPLCLGGNPFGWTADEAATFDILDAFVEGGGNFIDTADSYVSWIPGGKGGESETLIGRWMASRKARDRVVIATKVGGLEGLKNLKPQTIATAAEASLQRLGTDVIDLYYAHWDDDPPTPIEEVSAAFDALVKAGKVRQVGISNMSPERIEAWLEVAQAEGHAVPVALQPQYSLVARAAYEANIAPLARKNRLGVFPYYALASGFLTGKYRSPTDAEGRARGGAVARYLTPEGLGVLEELDAVAAERGASVTSIALAWLLAKPQVTAPIASVSRAEQLPDLLAATRIGLTPDEVTRLDIASARIR